MSLNKTMFTGRLTADPQLIYTRDNRPVARASIAVNRNYKDSNGERKADFFDIVVWNKYGESFAEWAKKGDLVSIVSRAENNNYEKDGVRHSRVLFRVEEWEILESKTARENRQRNAGVSGFDSGNFGQTPNFNRESPFPSPDPMTITDDDLPF